MTPHRPHVRFRTWGPLLLSLLLQNASIAQAPTTPAAAPTSGTPPASAPSSPPAANPDGTTAEATKAPPPPNKPVSERLRLDAEKLLASTKAPPTAMSISVKGKEILSFWSPDVSGKPVGAILMLHDNAESPRKPDTLLKLHRVLPKFGWATLSVQLPPLPPEPVPVRTSPTAAPRNTPGADASPAGDPAAPAKVDETKVVFQDEEAKTAEASKSSAETAAAVTPIVSNEEIIQLSMATLQAAVDYLQKEKQYNIVILGEGLGAVLALKFAGQAQLGEPPSLNDDGTLKEALVARPVRALILLNADFNERGAEAPDKLLRYPDIPTFDLITSVDESEEAYANLRFQISKKVKYKTYVSRRLMPLNRDTVDDQEDIVTKSIRGFLTQHAKGVVL